MTSFNNFRIIHGGLRYLQNLHISRLRESARERRWYLKNFPDLVEPLQCLMPLYGYKAKNPVTLGIALRVNDRLTRARNDGLLGGHEIPDGRVISDVEAKQRFPLVRADGLKGAALWHDAVVPNSNRLLMEVLRWSAHAGAMAVNYVEAMDLSQSNGRVTGVIATDALGGRDLEIGAAHVVNAAGPECRTVARRFRSDYPPLFRPSLAWNLLLDRPPLSDGAVAVQAPAGKSRVYFVHSLGGRMFVGTGHAPVRGDTVMGPTGEDIDAMLTELNTAVPGIELGQSDIKRIFWGQLPAKRRGSVDLADKPVMLDHSKIGGPRGLFSISGVKFTTARSAASRLVSMLEASRYKDSGRCFPERPTPAPFALNSTDCVDRAEIVHRAKQLIADEAPQSLVDLLFRRSNFIGDPGAAIRIAADCCAAFGWDKQESKRQTAALSRFLRRDPITTPD